MKRAAVAGVVLALSAAAIAWTVARAARDAGAPLRCADGLVAIGPRCCGEGQTLSGDRCVGEPARCAVTHERTSEGCVARKVRVSIAGGTLTLGPSDWEAEGLVAARELHVGALEVDAYELDLETHAKCVQAGACRGPVDRGDPGRASTMTFDEAHALCAFTGARLPTDDEWTFVSMGPSARRYPWGETGLVCSRAAFGLVDGPCARGAKGGDLAGARPGGKTTEGVHDLAGNVAEWTVATDGTPRARGGWVGSRLPSDFRGWRTATAVDGMLVGARCVVGAEAAMPLTAPSVSAAPSASAAPTASAAPSASAATSAAAPKCGGRTCSAEERCVLFEHGTGFRPANPDPFSPTPDLTKRWHECVRGRPSSRMYTCNDEGPLLRCRGLIP